MKTTYKSHTAHTFKSALFMLIFWMASLGTYAQVNPTLDLLLDELNQNYTSINNLIPNRFDFTDGETGYYIPDGGDDMYDYGNYLFTNIGGSIYYTNNTLSNSVYLGGEGKYFTAKYPGLFILAANLQDINNFSINGDLGAGYGSLIDAAILTSGEYKGFVKRVYDDNYGPSVNHLIIVKDDPAIEHTYSSSYYSDSHTISSLTNTSRLYYLLYAGNDGYYIDNEATQQIMDTFVALLKTDSIPPNPVTNLTITDILNSSAMAAWLAPSDDSLTEPVSAYDIRLNNQPITPANFENAPVYPNEIIPANPGASESLLIDGLMGETQYWIGIRSEDEGGNFSSAVFTSFTSGVDPEISVSVQNINIEIPVGQVTDESFAISNISAGSAPLSYSIETDIEPVNDIYSWALSEYSNRVYQVNLFSNETKSYTTSYNFSDLSISNQTGDLWLSSTSYDNVVVKSQDGFTEKASMQMQNLKKVCVPKNLGKAYIFRTSNPMWIDVYDVNTLEYDYGVSLINSSPDFVEVSHDGTRFYTADYYYFNIYDAVSGQNLASIDINYQASGIYPSPNGQYVICTTYNGYLVKIDLSNNSTSELFLNNDVRSVAISNDEQFVYVGDQYSGYPYIDAINAQNMQLAFSLEKQSNSYIYDLSVSADDRYLYSLEGNQSTITTYDLGIKHAVSQKQLNSNCEVFAFEGGFNDYITLAPASGILNAGEEQEITITISGDMMMPGIYSSTINIHSNDPANSMISIPLNISALDIIGPDFNMAFFQNQYLTSHLKVITFAHELLPEKPTLMQGSENIEVDVLDSLSFMYNSEYKLTTTENVTFTVSGKDSLGNASTFERTLSSTEVFKNAAITASYPNEEVQLDLPSGNFNEDLFVTIWKEELSDETIYHIGPGAEQMNSPAKLSIVWDVALKNMANPSQLAIYVKDDETDSWLEIPSMINKAANTVIVEIEKLGTFKIGNNESTHSSEVFGQNSLSDAVQISPNPFSGTTLISYQNLEEGQVHISIYDLAGNMVLTALDEYQPEGTNTISLDGNSLKNGVYFCKITTAKGEQQVKRLIKVE